MASNNDGMNIEAIDNNHDMNSHKAILQRLAATMPVLFEQLRKLKTVENSSHGDLMNKRCSLFDKLSSSMQIFAELCNRPFNYSNIYVK